MGKVFLQIKERRKKIGILKSLIYGGAAALFCTGLFLLLSKTNVFSAAPIFCLPVGLGIGVAVGLSFYLLSGKSDRALAKEIDERFDLKERVETMLDYQDAEGTLPKLQREDAEKSLSVLSDKQLFPSRRWISVLSLSLGTVMLFSALLVPNGRNQTSSETEVPFALTALQRVGMEKLIQDVKDSKMQEPYRSEISTELETLLQTLERTETQSAMRTALGESMAYVLSSTSSSSSMTEIATALWETDDEYAKTLAKVVNTSQWQERSKWWGDYAEKYGVFQALYAHTPAEGETEPDEQTLRTELKWKLENSALKIERALQNSSISKEDILYEAIDDLLYLNYKDAQGEPVRGFSALAEFMSELTYAQAQESLKKSFEETADSIYEAIETQKVNTDVGEGAMIKLSDLFLVPLPSFERPTLWEKGDSSESDGDEEDKGGGVGGGVGGGAAYGSDDYVLDPSTGEYVKYGELIAKYYALMTEKIENGEYTEAQKEAIKKYFGLLFSGLNGEDN